jgi:hypothetical protein
MIKNVIDQLSIVCPPFYLLKQQLRPPPKLESENIATNVPLGFNGDALTSLTPLIAY